LNVRGSEVAFLYDKSPHEMHLRWKYPVICQWIVDLGNLVETYSSLAPPHLFVSRCEKDLLPALFLSTNKLIHVLVPLPEEKFPLMKMLQPN